MGRRRSSRGQSAHDSAVERRAKELRRQGYRVDADLAGWKRPEAIDGVRPDIDARKGRDRVIVEVETQESKDDRRAQRQDRAFQKAASRSSSTRYQKVVTKK